MRALAKRVCARSEQNPLQACAWGAERAIRNLSLVAGPLCLLLIAASAAHAACTQHGTVGASSTQIAVANDVAIGNTQGLNGRHYFFLQNTGSNPMNVAIGSNNAATSADTLLAAGQVWVMTMQSGALVPGGDVAAITPASSTTYSFCDF